MLISLSMFYFGPLVFPPEFSRTLIGNSSYTVDKLTRKKKTLVLLACPQIFLSFLFSVYNRSITSVQDLWYDKRSQKCILLYDFTWWGIHVVNVGCCTNCFVPAKKNIMMQPDCQIKSIPIFSSLIFCICWFFFTVYLLECWGRGWVTLIETWLN